MAEPYPVRPYDVCRRMRMVTKAKMFGSIPGTISYFLASSSIILNNGIERMRYQMNAHSRMGHREMEVGITLELFLVV